MKHLTKKITSVLLAAAVTTSLATLDNRVYALGSNDNGGVFNPPDYNVSPGASENKLGLILVADKTSMTNDNVYITAYATQSVNYIIRYAKVPIPELELVEGKKTTTGTVKIDIPDLNATLIGKGTGDGKISGSLSGNVSGNASGSITGDYASGGWYGSGSGSVSGIVKGEVGGDVAGTIHVDVNGTLTGVIGGIGEVDGVSQVDISTYKLQKERTVEYNVPYVIPIYTQIMTPSGTYDGNMAKFTATQNGTYKFTARDTLGNTKVESITVSNIDKAHMDMIQWYTSKEYTSDGSIKNTLSEKSIDQFSNVRAYALNSDPSSLNTSYGFFIKISETYSNFNLTLLEDSGGLGVPVKTQSVGITPEEFYSTNLAIDDRDTKFSKLASLEDGIYVNPASSNGYKVLFMKSTQPKSLNSVRNVNISLENNAGTVINKSFKVEIEDKPSSYVVADNNYKTTRDKSSTLVFTRSPKVTLSSVTEVYDTEMYDTQVNLRKSNSNEINRFESVVNISNSFKDLSIRAFDVYLEKNTAIQQFNVGTILSEHEVRNSPTIIYNNNYSTKLDIITNPIDTMLNVSNLKQSIGSKNITIEFTPQLITSSQISTKLKELYAKYDIKESDFKVNLVDYSEGGISNSMLKIKDLNKIEDALTHSTAKNLNEYRNANVKVGSDIRLVFGIPGVFTDTVPLTSDLKVDLYNIDETQPLIADATTDNPFTINLNIESNGFKYSIPRDLEKVKLDGQIKSIKITINSREYDILTLNEAAAKKAFDITDEGIYSIKAEVINVYNTKKTTSKNLNIIKSDTIKNSLRLKNDPSILITKDGLYDIHTKRFKEYTIPNIIDPEYGTSLMGIRLSNNNIVIVSSKGNIGEVFTSTLDSTGTFNLTSTALDIMQYGSDVLIANGVNGVSILNVDNINKLIDKILPIESTIEGPVYCFERLNSMLLVGSENTKALRVYVNNPSGGFDLKEVLSASEIYESGNNQIKGLTVRNNKLEVYPGLKDYHIIIELP